MKSTSHKNQRNIFKNLSKSTLINLGLLVFIGFTLASCSSPAPTPVPVPACSSTNTIFNQLYNNVVGLPGYQNTVSYDTEIHEYTFTFSQTKTICSIGYQSQPAIAAVPYKMEIIDNNTNTVIYTGNHVFSSANTSYVSITPTPIIANQSYTVRRTMLVANAGNNFANIRGRLVNQPGALVSFPQSFGIMTITSANFYQNGGPLVNRGIPYIDFAYY